MSELENQRREDLRTWADKNNSFCVFVTLYELSSLIDPAISVPAPEHVLSEYERLMGMGKSGAVSPREFFRVLKTFTEPLAMEVRKVKANPSFIDKFEIPSDVSSKLQVVTGIQQVEYPNMRVLAKQREKRDWVTHTETDDNGQRLHTRIEPMLRNGWLTGMVVNFGKK